MLQPPGSPVAAVFVPSSEKSSVIGKVSRMRDLHSYQGVLCYSIIRPLFLYVGASLVVVVLGRQRRV